MSDQSEIISDLIVINGYLLTLLEGEIYFSGMHLGFCLDISLKPTYERKCLMKVSHIWKYVQCKQHIGKSLYAWLALFSLFTYLKAQISTAAVKNNNQKLNTGTDTYLTFKEYHSNFKKCDDNLRCSAIATFIDSFEVFT